MADPGSGGPHTRPSSVACRQAPRRASSCRCREPHRRPCVREQAASPLAGELYSNGRAGRPRVHDLHAALGGGTDAPVEHLHFAAFGLLDEESHDAQRSPFADPAEHLATLVAGGQRCHCVAFEHVPDATGVPEAYERLVAREGHEGIVIRSPIYGGTLGHFLPIVFVTPGMAMRYDIEQALFAAGLHNTL